jgi:hypothetical protein
MPKTIVLDIPEIDGMSKMLSELCKEVSIIKKILTETQEIWFTRKQAYTYANVSHTTLDRYILNGLPTNGKSGRLMRINKDELERFISGK